jgi:hypothetical protein
MADNSLPQGATLEPIQGPATDKAKLPIGATLEPYTPPVAVASDQPETKPKRFESPEHTAMRARIPALNPTDKMGAEKDVVGMFKGGAENLAGMGGATLGGPLGGAGAYLLSKRLLEPGAISEHPIATGLNAGAFLLPEVGPLARKLPIVGPLMEHFGERMSGSPLGRAVGEYAPKLRDWITDAPKELPPPRSPAPISRMLPERASGVQVGPSTLPETQPPRLSMREQVGGKIPGVPAIPSEAMPARAPSLGASTLEPRPEVVTGPVKPPSTRSLMNRLTGQIEDAAKYPAVERTAGVKEMPSATSNERLAAQKLTLETERGIGPISDEKMKAAIAKGREGVAQEGVGIPKIMGDKITPTSPAEAEALKAANAEIEAKSLRPGGSLGAKAVSAQPNTELSGPAIKTPSRNLKLLENMKNRVPGSNPIEPRVSMSEQPHSELRTPAQVEEESVHTMERMQTHVNGARTAELVRGKPGLHWDMINLEGEQIREVLRKSGEDMTNIQTVGRSGGKSGGFGGGKIVDPKNLARNEALDRLYEKGYTPEQIVKEAPPRSKPAPLRKAFGPPLKNPLSGEGL